MVRGQKCWRQGYLSVAECCKLYQTFYQTLAPSKRPKDNSSHKTLALPAPIPDKEEKDNLNFYFHTSLWRLIG